MNLSANSQTSQRHRTPSFNCYIIKQGPALLYVLSILFHSLMVRTGYRLVPLTKYGKTLCDCFAPVQEV